VTDLFNGVWSIDIAESKVWSSDLQRYVADEVGSEVITLKIQGGVQDYEVVYGDVPVITMGYTSTYDDPQWVPYLVRNIANTGMNSTEAAVAEFKQRISAVSGSGKRNFEVGKPYGLVRTIYVDARTHYRISKEPEGGAAQGIMLRRLSDDGSSFTSTVLDVNGVIFRIRRFVREGSP
jgi:hypothetical protein